MRPPSWICVSRTQLSNHLTHLHKIGMNVMPLADAPTPYCLLGAFATLRKATISFVMSVSPSVGMEQLGSNSTDFHEIWYLSIFENISGKFNFHYHLTSITSTLHEDLSIFMPMSLSVLISMRKVSDKSCRENQTHILRSITFFRKSCPL
jgi:hypothetical protein